MNELCETMKKNWDNLDIVKEYFNKQLFEKIKSKNQDCIPSNNTPSAQLEQTIQLSQQSMQSGASQLKQSELLNKSEITKNSQNYANISEKSISSPNKQIAQITSKVNTKNYDNNDGFKIVSASNICSNSKNNNNNTSSHNVNTQNSSSNNYTIYSQDKPNMNIEALYNSIKIQ